MGNGVINLPLNHLARSLGATSAAMCQEKMIAQSLGCGANWEVLIVRLNQSFIASSSGGACAWQVWDPV